jgi:hypothetical protein
MTINVEAKNLAGRLVVCVHLHVKYRMSPLKNLLWILRDLKYRFLFLSAK